MTMLMFFDHTSEGRLKTAIRSSTGGYLALSSCEEVKSDGYSSMVCHVGVTTVFTIVNYHFSDSYVVYSDSGTVTINGDEVSFTPTAAGNAGFWINTSYHAVTVLENVPDGPLLDSPGNESVVRSSTFWLNASPYHSPDAGMTHHSSHWQIATDAAFTNLVVDTVTTTALTEIEISGLTSGQSYYARVKYIGEKP